MNPFLGRIIRDFPSLKCQQFHHQSLVESLSKGTHSVTPGSGRPGVTTVRENRYICVTARPSSLRVATSSGIVKSRQAFCKNLHESHKYFIKPSIQVPLTSLHIRARLQWGQYYIHWSPQKPLYSFSMIPDSV
ncbi:hypothetical protein TNCT_269991 [Trichonephila clavata]|uniref:Uncharacterized protein n=1 Tax=Trichonephila clavata TaxID=2740835 RepID=A0A8X6JP95_TRICU|nr:hypothetical protein TNCT_269991 [Trichonephila clavata]